MKSFPLNPLLFTSFTVVSLSSTQWSTASSYKNKDFLRCLSIHSTDIPIYTPINSSYTSTLRSYAQNPRFSTQYKTLKPLAIIKPSHVSHIQSTVICSKSHGLQIRIRSGGHDTEGLSYISDLPFIVVDLINLKSIEVDTTNNTVWVQSGATIGELYYRIAEKSRTLAFPAGVCPTVGVGGQFSGGGYGWLMRKYGLAADNVIDAYLVDANGMVFDSEAMGEGLFWAIRGGGGGSFGIVVGWKVKLVRVPPIVTTCRLDKSLDKNTKKIVYQWQYVANKMEENLLIGINLTGGNPTKGVKRNPTASFFSLYLGKTDKLIKIMNTTFPNLGLTKANCKETSWIQSTLIAAGFTNGQPLEILLTKPTLSNNISYKIKSDYVKQPISEHAFKGIWDRLQSHEVETSQLFLFPYGGKMNNISSSKTPFSHRAEFLYKISYTVGWAEQGTGANERHLNWIRELYSFMTPFVSNSPRAAYVNYRDLDIGTNNKCGKTSYEEASIWGMKYFGNNFKRLVQVKTMVDPSNFFRHQQSIPPLTLS
ncbi:tetrahydrocannabinolic acid synthase-like [Cucumis melo var. makuwa]|uniref:Tetrahydrocannabinolic acid synthase-like n=2 Tax=Cucumis melo TaxID=3656 RepID=A0A1S3BDG4_CUCME|nr:tetrahydroberberine oxidase-like [Cucumis melo]KAA0047086.1 tetrahydrocannabinolic acid synthase-like [Cucumis melo var. makuwa]TYK05069.1 tetrahydrocannabinolic acid synthase-like [Cucumis melo var. makuwa]